MAYNKICQHVQVLKSNWVNQSSLEQLHLMPRHGNFLTKSLAHQDSRYHLGLISMLRSACKQVDAYGL
jgi:hypothetical protein